MGVDFEGDRMRPQTCRICVRDSASSNREDEGGPVGEDRQADGVQTRQRRRKNMAAI